MIVLIKLAQPLTVNPWIIPMYKIQKVSRTENTDIANPKIIAAFKGLLENAIMISNAKLNLLLIVYDVVPAKRLP
jgi:hypothetical protein